MSVSVINKPYFLPFLSKILRKVKIKSHKGIKNTFKSGDLKVNLKSPLLQDRLVDDKPDSVKSKEGVLTLVLLILASIHLGAALLQPSEL